MTPEENPAKLKKTKKKISKTKSIDDKTKYILHIPLSEQNDNIEHFTFDGTDDVLTRNLQFIKIDKKEIITDDSPATNFEELLKQKQQERDKFDKQLKKRLQNIKFDSIVDEIKSGVVKDLNLNQTHIISNQDSTKLTLKDINGLNVNQVYKETKVNKQLENRKQGYFEILYNFVHNKNWLKHTDVCCWWCCHQFDTLPLGFPIKLVNKETGDRTNNSSEFIVTGLFCSFACMKSYKMNSIQLKHKDNSLMQLLYLRLTGKNVIHESGELNSIIPAPPRETLQMFGGILTIDEFRDKSKEEIIYNTFEYPLTMYSGKMTETKHIKQRQTNNKTLLENSVMAKDIDSTEFIKAKQRINKTKKTKKTIDEDFF